MATSDSPLNISAARTLHVTLNAANNSLFPEFLASFVPEQTVRTFSEATHYASPVATAPGDGTLQNPWTFRQAMDNAVAGNIVGLLPGKWYGENTSGYTGQGKRLYPAFRPENTGTESEPIWFVAQYPAAHHAANRTEIYSGGSVKSDSWPAFGSYRKDYIRYSGIYTDTNDPNGQIHNDCGPATVRTGTGCGLHLCHIVGKPNLAGGENNSAVRTESHTHFEVADCIMEGFSGPVNNTGVTVYSNTGLRIHNNEFRDLGYPLQLKGSPVGLRFYRNKVTNCRMGSQLHHPSYTSPEDLSWIYGNIFDNCGYIYRVTTTGVGMTINGLVVFNNTFHNITRAHDPGAINWGAPIPAEDLYDPFFNNIISACSNILGSYMPRPSTPAELARYTQLDHNVYPEDVTFFGSGPLSSFTFQDWQAVGQDTGSVKADPLFSDTAAGDFSLQSGSPAIGLGLDKLGMFGPRDGVVDSGAYPNGVKTQIGVRA